MSLDTTPDGGDMPAAAAPRRQPRRRVRARARVAAEDGPPSPPRRTKATKRRARRPVESDSDAGSVASAGSQPKSNAGLSDGVKAAAEAEAAAAVHNIVAAAIPALKRRRIKVPAPVLASAKAVKGMPANACSAAELERQRKNRNRDSAALSRLRKQKYMEALESQVVAVTRTNLELEERVRQLEALTNALTSVQMRRFANAEAQSRVPALAPAPAPTSPSGVQEVAAQPHDAARGEDLIFDEALMSLAELPEEPYFDVSDPAAAAPSFF